MNRLLLICTLCVGFVGLCACGSKQPDPARTVEVPAKAPRADLLKMPEELNKPTEIVSQASIDIVNEVLAKPADSQQHVFHAKSGAPLWFRGWAYDASNQKVPDRVYIELTGQTSGLKIYIPATRMKREDVATGFNVPWAVMSGFTTADLVDHNIPPGTYGVKIYQIDNQTAMQTAYYGTAAVTLVMQ